MWTPLKAKKRAADIDRELRAHVELEAEEQQQRGLSEEEAADAARRQFGSTARAAEDVRAVWTVMWLDALRRDLRYAARSLRKNAGFAIVAVLTLALGIGANSAIFTAVDALMFRSLPFDHPERLLRVYATRDGVRFPGQGGPSPPDAHDYAQATRTLQNLVVYDVWRKNVSFREGDALPEQRRVGLITREYFETLGIRPILGRLFTADEAHNGSPSTGRGGPLPGNGSVAAIGAHLWETRFERDPNIIGRTLRINDELYTIVSVMPDVVPPWMEGGEHGHVEIWTPDPSPESWPESARGSHGTDALARLKPGVSLEQAQAELSLIAARLADAHAIDRNIGVLLEPLADTRVGTLGPTLLLMAGAVGLILLIACVNLANLLLARNSSRERELALRTALGAGRSGLVRQMLVETLLLSILGAAVGVALARIATAALASNHPVNLPQLDEITIDWRVLAFTILVSLATTLLFGLGPALTASQIDLADALKQGGRGHAGGSGRRLRSALVVAEMAMSLMLLVGAGLLTQSLVRLQQQGLGIRPDHLLKGHFYLPPVHYPDGPAITRFCDALTTRLRAIPGVVDASVTTAYPPTNGWAQFLIIPGRPVVGIADVPTAEFGVADAHFLTTLGIPLVRGRNFEESDTATGAPVGLISAEFSRRYFPTEDPIGRRIHIGPPPFLRLGGGANTLDDADVTIIGVAGDFRNAGLALRPAPHITVLYAQHPRVNYGFKDIVIRTASDPHAVAPEIARELHKLDANLPFSEVQTMEEVIEQSTGGQRLTATLLGSFAVAGFALAMVGIYGVVSFVVAQRKVELAVRMAIGASRVRVLGTVLSQSMGMAGIGVIVGLAGAVAAQRLTRGLLFEISPLDGATFAGASALLLAVATIATLIPGLRAARIDPARTLTQN